MSMQQAIDISTSASDKIYQLMEEEHNLELKLRVYITGGGCHGFQYNFAFEQEQSEDDIAFDTESTKKQHVRVIIDPISLQYLDKSTIDYISDAQGERFIINNPNAKTTCGCNNSFSA